MSEVEAAPQTQTPKPVRAPKLAPAPVPQETPWKAPAVDGSATKPSFEAVEAAKPAKKQSSAEPKDSGSSKRATTGKEKWVPYAPVVPVASSSSGSGEKKGGRGKRQQNGQNSNSVRGRRAQGDSQGSSNSDKRKSGNYSNNSSRGAGHQRAQFKGSRDSSASSTPPPANGSDPAAALESLQLNSDAEQPSGEAGLSSPNSHSEFQGTQGSQRGERGERPRSAPHSNNKSNFRQSGMGRKPKYANSYRRAMYAPPYQMMPMPVQDLAYPPEYLFSALVHQVNHYFSVGNLCRDMYLRSNMNDEGLVPIDVISNFNRVKQMTTDIGIVYQACQTAPNAVVIGNKVRASQDWQNWILPMDQRSPAGKDNSPVDDAVEQPSEPKFHVQQAVPFVPRGY